nr:hypothetical protein [Tanacetum cinerariifolium]
HHTPTSEASQSSQPELPSPSLPPVPPESLPIVIPTDTPLLRKYTRRTRITQSSVLPPVADEPASPLGDDNQGCFCCQVAYFDIWKMRIEQFFLMTNYSSWEVILNGDSPVPTRIIEGVIQPVAPTTAEQKLARKNELKARG